MPLYLPDLDLTTREHMLREFDMEQSDSPYVPAVLSAYGVRAWQMMMRDAIEFGDDTSLLNDLLRDSSVFNEQE